MGAEGLLSGWRSAFLPLLSPLSLSHKDMQIHGHTRACTRVRKRNVHAHPHSRLTRSARDTREKSLCVGTLRTYAYVIRRTSPSQPEDKGAVVARQQVFLAPTHLEAAGAPTIFQ